ncbi:MAG: (5-formylfuran-3-yl)methyl phosphate synthase [Candidatus Bathyarchaeia archaeon]|nr:(5-formylfuran-3-yl)methyl phosphate synthase [Candidatus Bathyarchaeota archaeon]
MKLLVSVTDEIEALEALKGGCDILDVKNPSEGALGAAHPTLIKKIVEAAEGKIEISVTIGDLPNLPGTASLAALGAASLGVNYVKAGLYNVKNVNEALKMANWIVKAVKSFYPKVKVIICGYADYASLGLLNPLNLPDVAKKAEADGILVDVKNKSFKNLFHYLSFENLMNLIEKAHNYGLTVALAGSLNLNDVEKVKKLKADIIGVRRSVCDLNNWLNGRIKSEKVKSFFEVVKA